MESYSQFTVQWGKKNIDVHITKAKRVWKKQAQKSSSTSQWLSKFVQFKDCFITRKGKI